jgi:hypothetical protein
MAQERERTLVAQAPDQQLADQDRYCDQHHAYDVHEHERAASAHAHDVREFPDVAETDRGADCREYECRP